MNIKDWMRLNDFKAKFQMMTDEVDAVPPELFEGLQHGKPVTIDLTYDKLGVHIRKHIEPEISLSTTANSGTSWETTTNIKTEKTRRNPK